MKFFDDVAFPYVVGEEGALSMDPLDPGNWTGGKCKVGALKGTKYGVSAASYPDVDIAALTLEDAKGIAKRDFWDKFNGDALLPAIAFCVFDFGYNAGVHESVKVLQRSLLLKEDGVCGPVTIAAANNADPMSLINRFTGTRKEFYRMLPTYSRFGRGWDHRADMTAQNARAM